MRNIAKYILIATVLLMPFLAHAYPVTPGFGGGTGISTTTAANVNKCLTVSSSSPYLLWTIGACGSGGGSSTTFNGLTTSTLTVLGSASVTVVSSTDSNGGQVLTLSASGGSGSSTNVFGINGVTVTQVGVNATASINESFANIWAALQSFNLGAVFNSTSTHNSSTIFTFQTSTLLSTDSNGKVQTTTYGGAGLTFSGNTLTWSNTPGFLTNASVTATSPMTWSAGSVIACPTCSVGMWVSTSSNGTANALPLWTGNSALGNSQLAQAAGGITDNGTQIIDGGANWIYNVVQSTGANVIIQPPTSTAILGQMVQGGAITIFNTTTTLTGAQFCGTGLGYVQNTTNTITITIPATSTVVGFSCNTGTQKIYSGTWSTQHVYNNSTNTVLFATTGDSEVQIFKPGTPTSLAPGQDMIIMGIFASSSQSQFATGTGMTLYAIYEMAQTSTPFTVSGNTVTMSGTVSSTESSVLILAAANGTWGAYGGASACAE